MAMSRTNAQSHTPLMSFTHNAQLGNERKWDGYQCQWGGAERCPSAALDSFANYARTAIGREKKTRKEKRRKKRGAKIEERMGRRRGKPDHLHPINWSLDGLDLHFDHTEQGN